jgi:hypothetical protein
MWIPPSHEFPTGETTVRLPLLSSLLLLVFWLSSPQGICFFFFHPPPRPQANRHFDRSGSRPCERRSGEIRFSASTSTQPKPRLLLSSRRACPERSRMGVCFFFRRFRRKRSHVKPSRSPNRIKTQQTCTFRTLRRLANSRVEPSIIELRTKFTLKRWAKKPLPKYRLNLNESKT